MIRSDYPFETKSPSSLHTAWHWSWCADGLPVLLVICAACVEQGDAGHSATIHKKGCKQIIEKLKAGLTLQLQLFQGCTYIPVACLTVPDIARQPSHLLLWVSNFGVPAKTS